MGRTIKVFGFPSHVTAEEVKKVLEKYTGKGAVYTLKVRQSEKEGSGAYCIVQFTTPKKAKSIIGLVHEGLQYSGFNLKVQYAKGLQKPRTLMFGLVNTTLHFGCQLSDNKFCALWKEVDVEVKISSGLQKLSFFLSHQSVNYKLELSYESLWQIQLFCTRRTRSKFLLIQVLGAPRIYEKPPRSSGHIFEDPTLDDQWVRTTDFTPSCSIGQSSALCLELPYNCKLPEFRENFSYYKENEGKFVLENGNTFSRNLDMVPIVCPDQGLDLPYKILCKINCLVQHGCLPGPSLDDAFFRLVDPNKLPIAFIEHALEILYHQRDCCYEPVKWLAEQYRKYSTSNRLAKQLVIPLDAGLVNVHRILITPCKIYFCGPELIVSNSVLRKFAEDIDNFIRVSFVDEDLDKLHPMDLSTRAYGNEERHTKIYERILSILRNGIIIGKKKFDFLAFSSSQLRENSLWMFASRNGLTTSSIRAWMGDFHDHMMGPDFEEDFC